MLAIRLEDVKNIRIQYNFAEKEKAKTSSFKLKTGSRAESSPKGDTSILKNNSTSQCRRRDREAGKSILGSKPPKPDADKPEKKRNLLQITCFNYSKKDHFINIYSELKKASGPL
jgi:hypothetical protein